MRLRHGLAAGLLLPVLLLVTGCGGSADSGTDPQAPGVSPMSGEQDEDERDEGDGASESDEDEPDENENEDRRQHHQGRACGDDERDEHEADERGEDERDEDERDEDEGGGNEAGVSLTTYLVAR